MAYKYSFEKYDKESMVRVCRTNVPISLKKSVELARYLRNKDVKDALKTIEDIIHLKKPIPYVRYYQEMAHQKGKGIATGGYPVKVAKEFERLIKLGVAASKEKELGENLKIVSISARKGSSVWHYGRYLGRKAKRTHIELVLGVKQND